MLIIMFYIYALYCIHEFFYNKFLLSYINYRSVPTPLDMHKLNSLAKILLFF